ncbi:MAG: 1-deoxy-D-xylulose-5-phosphate reductoisomerase [Planctomycetota bacterium]
MPDAAQRVVLLGSTGSIGTNTLSVIENLPDRFSVAGLSAGAGWETLAEQTNKYRPEAIALAQSRYVDRLREAITVDAEVYDGADAAVRLVEEVDADIVVGGITGWAGFRPSLRAVELGHTLALANKETLVVGGNLVQTAMRQSGADIVPVDSEQSAIFQAMGAGEAAEIERIILTASGGPFHGMSREERREVTPDDALCHPNWQMGKKITIDSATMMNKALEVIETRWLFDVPVERIEVLIHPQSIIHSMVEFVDGSVMAQMGSPDMRLPIQYALTYPERVECCGDEIEFGRLCELELMTPDAEERAALELGYEVAREGGTSGAVFNAANEIAVDAFLDGELDFTDIVPLVRNVLSEHDIVKNPDVDELSTADQWARKEAQKCLVHC